MSLIEEKLGNKIDLLKVSQLLCEKYQLGNYRRYHLIDTGIEDLNYCLEVENKKYLVKLFNKQRKREDFLDYIKKHKFLEDNKIAMPKILAHLEMQEVFLVIMEYVEGQDLFSSKERITKQDVMNLMRIVEKVHQIPNKTECIYDEYHLHHFIASYQMCVPFLSEEWRDIGEELKKQYCEIDFSQMPKTFIHGDLHKGNMMRDNQGKLYLIDFSSCGYSYRIIDVVEFINNTLFDYREMEISKQRIHYFWEHCNLTDYERENVKILIMCYAFISIALKQYDFCHNQNQRKENEYWIQNSRAILEAVKKI